MHLQTRQPLGLKTSLSPFEIKSPLSPQPPIPQIEIGDRVEKAVKSLKQLLASFFEHEKGLNPSDTSVTLDEVCCSSARHVRKPRLAFQQT
jgi:hypothetical protein